MSEENHKETNNVDTKLVENTEKDKTMEVETENYADKYLIYGVNDSPPLHITLVCGLQVCTFLKHLWHITIVRIIMQISNIRLHCEQKKMFLH